nr:helix-turn-helix domain-containing protein [Providencia stuartii]
MASELGISQQQYSRYERGLIQYLLMLY